MAKVDYTYPVDALHGKVKKEHKVGFAKMRATGTKYTQSYGVRSTAVKPSEVQARQKFAQVSAATIARMRNISTIANDTRAWKAQSKYKTLRGWIFRQEWDSYEG